MYNPEFWEIRLDQVDLEQYPNEANIWYETGEDRVHRYQREDRVDELADAVYDFLSQYLTQKQCEVVVLYFIYQKTQQETAEILGISRRVVSQHLFGICRDGKHIGGAVNKLRKMCTRHGIDFHPAERKFETQGYSEQLAISA